MFAMWARMVPNGGLRRSFSDDTRATPFSTTTSVPVRIGAPSSPWGPLTRTKPSATATLTPLGIGTGLFPTLDIRTSSPHLTEDLAAEPGFASLAVGHQATWRGEDRRAESTHDSGDLGLADVHAAARRAHPSNAVDHAHVLVHVLEIDPQDALLPVLDHLEVVDEAPAQERLGDLRLQPRGRNVHLALSRADGIAHAGEEIRHRITDRHVSSWDPASGSRSTTPARPAHWLLRSARSPARLDDARNLARERQLAEADPAQAEVPQVAARSSASVAPCVGAHLELRSALPFLDDRFLRHSNPR